MCIIMLKSEYFHSWDRLPAGGTGHEGLLIACKQGTKQQRQKLESKSTDSYCCYNYGKPISAVQWRLETRGGIFDVKSGKDLIAFTHKLFAEEATSKSHGRATQQQTFKTVTHIVNCLIFWRG